MVYSHVLTNITDQLQIQSDCEIENLEGVIFRSRLTVIISHE